MAPDTAEALPVYCHPMAAGLYFDGLFEILKHCPIAIDPIGIYPIGIDPLAIHPIAIGWLTFSDK